MSLLRLMTRLLAECYERCELEAQNPLPMTAVNIFSQRSISRNIHLRTLGCPIQINGTFWNILKSRIITQVIISIKSIIKTLPNELSYLLVNIKNKERAKHGSAVSDSAV